MKRINGSTNNVSLFDRYRRNKGFWVTDFTNADWCEKKMEFSFQLGKPKATRAMKAGSARHAQLEDQDQAAVGAVKQSKVLVPESAEDTYAKKCLNLILGANRLLCDGLTRELPIVSFAHEVWMVGKIDEIRLSSDGRVSLVDTKTRERNTLPLEAQRRNGRLQLMLYKLLWDTNIVATKNIASKQIFDDFGLNPNSPLSGKIRAHAKKCGFPSEVTLQDIMAHVRHACSMFPMADDELMLRYEFQQDYSLLEEDKFAYDYSWLKTKIDCSLEYLNGEREANCTPPEERWKCKSCDFASHCPALPQQRTHTLLEC